VVGGGAVSTQSPFSVITPVKPGRVEALGTLLDDIGDHIADNPYIRFDDLKALHYASFVIFDQDTPEPFLLFEGNVDGSTEAFLRGMVECAGTALDAIYAHCAGYPGPGSADADAVVAYLMERDLGADTFYIAWRGRSVEEIRCEQALREHLEHYLDGERAKGALAGLSPEAIRARLQEVVSDEPSLQWALTAPKRPFLVRRGKAVVNAVAAVLGLALLVLLTSAWRGRTPRGRLARLAVAKILGLAGAVAWALRSHERADDRRDAARAVGWEAVYAEWSANVSTIVQRENVQGQNHLASITRIKEGWFRLALLRVVLWVINLAAAVIDNQGELAGISSIHFARWVITADRRHLVFLSNFDGSWERYLNDFIDLSSPGLTAVWSNTDNEVGFPSTRWLTKDGALDEQRFKSYTRRSQARTRAWYSAYPDLSVENISNNMVIREQLFGPLDDTEAWLRRF